MSVKWKLEANDDRGQGVHEGGHNREARSRILAFSNFSKSTDPPGLATLNLAGSLISQYFNTK